MSSNLVGRFFVVLKYVLSYRLIDTSLGELIYSCKCPDFCQNFGGSSFLSLICPTIAKSIVDVPDV